MQKTKGGEHMKLSNKTYDILKRIVTVIMPAFITFYGVLGATLKIPYTQETLTILGALTTFLGVSLGASTSSYNKSMAEMSTSDKIDQILSEEDDLK